MAKRVIASYCSSFLKPEMLHIYRQVKALRRVKTFVMTKELQNAERFPFRDIEIIPKQRMNLLRHGWLKFVKRRPPVFIGGNINCWLRSWNGAVPISCTFTLVTPACTCSR